MRCAACGRDARPDDRFCGGCGARLDPLPASDVVDDLIRDYRKALADRPDDASTLFSLGLALVRKGWTEEALAALRRAQTIEPGVPDVAREIARIEKTVTERRRDTRL